MSKKAKSAPTPPASTAPAWLTFALIALFGALFGATLMFFALRPRQPASVPAPGAALSPDPTSHLPDPSLTAGKPPAEAARILGNFYYDHRNWPQAITQYESAIRQGQDDADIRTDLGNAYRFAGRPDDALRQYEYAQRLDPNHEFSLFNQGGLFLEGFNQPDRAVETWQTYLSRFPNGRSVAAARQLIAQWQGGGTASPTAAVASGAPAPSVPAPTPAPNKGPDAAESLILRQLEAARTKPSAP